MTTNEIVQQTEQLFHSEYENDNIDETILVAMTNEHRTFCLTIENFLIQFVNSSKYFFPKFLFCE